MTTTKNILVLGATGGIGSAIAHSLANKNTHLILHGNSLQKLTALQEELVSTCHKITLYEADLSEDKSIQKLASDLKSSYESFDWIINAAGYIDEKENTHSYPNLVQAFLINTVAPIHVTQKLQNKISSQGGVIMISSTAALWGNPEFPIYAATKGALNTFTTALSKQFEESDKTAVVICPGGTNTQMRERLTHDSKLQQPPEVIAKQVEEIVENRSDYSNGNIVVIKDSGVIKYK